MTADMPITSFELLARWLHRGDGTAKHRLATVTRVEQGWVEQTYGGLDRSSGGMAAQLAVVGVQPGDRVALLAESGGDWASAFIGILRRGAVVVPLDCKLTSGELVPLIQRSRLAAAVVSSAQADRWAEAGGVAGVNNSLPVLDPDRPYGATPIGASDVARPLQEPSVLVWTSGTTGTPKGVTLSLANVAYVVAQASAVHGRSPGARMLSILPPNHVLELCCGLLPGLAAGSTTFVARTVVPHEVASLMAECRISQMLVVPMVLRMIKRQIEAEIRRPGLVGAYLRGAMVMAQMPFAPLRRLLFQPVHRRLGGHLSALYCGGAPLDGEVAGFFERMGFGVYQGYGLTEAGPTVAMNGPGRNRAGSVGRPIRGTEVRIASDGEILVRGPGVMLGYWDDEAASREAVDPEGWLHTGDLGHFDGDGFLFVTGRAKSVIVLDSGKNVQPEEVENVLARSGLLTETCVVGWSRANANGRRGEQVCAVVVPADELSQEAAEEEVHRITASLSGFKRPTVVRVLEGPLPLTAKRSVRRDEVVRLLDQQEVAGRLR